MSSPPIDFFGDGSLTTNAYKNQWPKTIGRSNKWNIKSSAGKQTLHGVKTYALEMRDEATKQSAEN